MFYPKIDLLLQQGRHAEAEAAIREDLRDSMDDPMLFVLLSIALRAQEKYHDSEDAARQAIGIDPELDVAWWSLAQTQLERRERKAALESVNKALSIDPHDADYFALKARILSESDKENEALEAAEAGLAIEPENDNCRFFRSILLANLGRHDEAAAESAGLLADDPEDAGNHSAAGWVMAQRGDGRGAQQHFIEALRIDPESEDAREGLAFSLKLSNPILGALLRMLIALDRLPMIPALIGTIVLLQLCDHLADSDYPAPLPQIGYGLRIALVLFFVISLAINPLFDLVLYSSRRTRHALSTEKMRSIKWLIVPLLLGFALVTLWIAGGARSLPFHGAAWFAVARLISEAFDTGNDWARRRMHALSMAAAAVALWVLFVGVVLAPQWKREMVAKIGTMMEEDQAEQDAKSGTGEAPSEAKASDPAVAKVLPMEQSQAHKQMRGLIETMVDRTRFYVRLPVLALWLLSALSNDIANSLTRRAPRNRRGVR